MSLLYNEFIDKIELKSSGNFYSLFANCTNLIDISKLFLPATTLTTWCYAYMFSGCTSLIYAPEKLPALILKNDCYECMFHSCESLTYAPELPATQLADACYNAMFYNCRSLIQTPELPSINLANYCYNGMFMNCVNITQIPNLPALILANKQCYCNMFNGCYSLQGIINLPAIKLTYLCYNKMFFECNNLTKAYLYFSDFSDNYNYSLDQMLYGTRNLKEIHYKLSLQNNSEFLSISGSPYFGATNATVYFDL